MTTIAQRQEIAAVAARIAASPIALAVVDYGPDFAARGSSRRYGERDLRHVAIYGLAPVACNDAAKPLLPNRAEVYPRGYASDDNVTLLLGDHQDETAARILTSRTYGPGAHVAHFRRPAPPMAPLPPGAAAYYLQGDNT